MDSALQSVASPFRETTRWNYLMNVRVRLLLFWAGFEDVGGGYIQKGTLPADPSAHVIRLLIGSDPQKAPRRINHWGSAMEIYRGDAESVFFGFMKSSKAASAKEAEIETSRTDAFGFEASINRADSSQVLSRIVALRSPQNYTFRDLPQAQEAMIRRASHIDGPVRRLAEARPGCRSTQGFLGAVEHLVDQAIKGRPAPLTDCYVHNARYYTVTLKKTSKVESKRTKMKLRDGKTLDRTDRDLLQADFEVFNTESRERTRFDLLLGASGDLRGVPVQIHYQPNWWFQVVLHLDTKN
jgi:hypothetical protein